MTALKLLTQLRHEGIKLWVEHDQIHFEAPKNALTPTLRKQITEQKPELLDLLKESNGRAKELPLVPIARTGSLPLSFAQQRLWFLQQLEPNSPAYNMRLAWRLEGALNVGAVAQSLQALVHRHETLRSCFPAEGGQPSQVIRDSLTIPLNQHDLRSLSEAECDASVRQLTYEEDLKPFNLAEGPVIRATLLQLRDEEYVFLITMHHIISDGWSLGVLRKDFTALYRAFSTQQPCPPSELPIQYVDFAHWQRQWLTGKVLEGQLAYWRRQLAGIPTLQLPTDRPRPAVQTHNGAMSFCKIPESIKEGLFTIGRHEGITLATTLLAAFQTLLSRYTGQTDIAVGSPIANRNRMEVEGLIGFFTNTLVMRTDLSGDPSFREVLQRVHQVALGAHDHQDLPFERLVEELHPERDLSRNPLFQVMFAVQNTPSEGFTLPGVTVRGFGTGSKMTKFDLECHILKSSEGLNLTFVYNTDLFGAETIKRMGQYFQTVLEEVVRDPGQRLSQIPLLSEAQRRQLLVEWNNTRTTFPPEQCIHQVFEQQEGQSPEAVAVVFGDQQLTYRELNTRANQLAHYLKKQGVGPEVLVGLCMEQSLELVIGLVGILKAGGAYVPLDPEYPEERLTFMFQDSGIDILLTQQSMLTKLPVHQAKDLCLDVDWSVLEQESKRNPICNTTPENLAYIIYTSGSTGQPKGTSIRHRSVVRLVHHTNYVELQSSDRIAQTATISFDAATFELWGALLHGAQLVIIPKATTLSPQDFSVSLQRYGITTMFLTTALFNHIAREVPGAFQGVRNLLFGGEAVDPQWVTQILQTAPPERLLHVYGPTECTTFTTWHLTEGVAPGEVTVPIGQPIANTQVYVLDRKLHPVPIGAYGELYIGGDGLAQGYLHRPALTAEKFVPHPFSEEPGMRLYKTGDMGRYLSDGAIEFLGRVDQQVKVRGFRIELGEIESVLSRHPNVAESAVTVQEDETGDKRLVGYVVPTNGTTLEPTTLRQYLQTKLPNYMLPSTLMILDTFPLTPNGKLDRKSLPIVGHQPTIKTDRAELITPIERQLQVIWEQNLGVSGIGIHDNFFNLGGHSLMAAKMFFQIETIFHSKLPLSVLFTSPTIHEFSNLLASQGGSPSWSSLIPIQPSGTSRPFFAVPGVGGNVICFSLLSHLLGPTQPFYGFQSQGLDGKTPPFSTIEAMAAHYIGEMQTIQPSGPYCLGGVCIGGVIAYEMAQQLLAQGEQVALLALMEPSAPRTKKGTHGVFHSPGRNLLLKYAYPLYYVWHLTVSHFKTSNTSLDFTKLVMNKIGYLVRLLKEKGNYEHQQSLLNIDRVSNANRFALLQYIPQKYSGRIVHFLAKERPIRQSSDRRKKWEHLCTGEFQSFLIPGENSGRMLRQPGVQELAPALKEILQSLQSKN